MEDNIEKASEKCPDCGLDREDCEAGPTTEGEKECTHKTCPSHDDSFDDNCGHVTGMKSCNFFLPVPATEERAEVLSEATKKWIADLQAKLAEWEKLDAKNKTQAIEREERIAELEDYLRTKKCVCEFEHSVIQDECHYHAMMRQRTCCDGMGELEGKATHTDDCTLKQYKKVVDAVRMFLHLEENGCNCSEHRDNRIVGLETALNNLPKEKKDTPTVTGKLVEEREKERGEEDA